MNVPVVKRSALADFAEERVPAGERVGVDLLETVFEGYYNLRCDAGDPAIAEAAAATLGTALPASPNTVAAGNGVTVYWLGPDEWLLVTPDEEDKTLADALADRLAGRWFSLTAISGGMTHLTVSGPRAADALAQGTTIDLHPRAFDDNRCAQSILGRASVLMARSTAVGGGFEVFVRRSFADHLLRFLRDASRDYGFEFRRAG